MSDLTPLRADELPLVYALALYDAPLSQTRLMELLQLRSQKTATSGAYDIKRLKESLASLCQSLLVRQEIGLGYVLRDDVRMPVLLQLQQAGWLKSWVGSVRELLKRHNGYSQWQTYDAAFCRREVVFSALAGKSEEQMSWSNKFFDAPTSGPALPGTAFFSSDDGITLFATLANRAQAMLLTDMFFRANWYLDDCSVAYDYACARFEVLAKDWPPLIELLCWQALLRGDIAQLQLLQQATHAQPESLIALAIFRGDFALACEMADVYVKALKAQMGKRKLFLPELIGLLYTVALLAKKDAASLKRAKEQVDDGVKQHHAYTITCCNPWSITWRKPCH
jgi:hypothetical protein